MSGRFDLQDGRPPSLNVDDDRDLTVVVACVEASRSIERCMLALVDSCTGLHVQIIAADASRDRTAALVKVRWPEVTVLHFPPGTLVPQLWAAGVGLARGRVVAFTIGHVAVARTWARAVVNGLEHATGVGGPLILAGDAGVVDWAVFYLRYSAFLPSQMPEGIVVGEIAGDNSAYTRTALARHASSLVDGFWEVEFHRRLRAEGGSLGATWRAGAAFSGSSPFVCLLRHRYAHGRHYGASRVAHGSSSLRIVAAAPLVPLVLAWRAAQRIVQARERPSRFLLALPFFMPLAAAWAMGEAHGALTGAPARTRPRPLEPE